MIMEMNSVVTSSEKRIRGHHIRELYLFKHEGRRQYEDRTEWQGKEFSKLSSDLLKKLIKNGDFEIRVVIGLDSICDLCPPSNGDYRRTCENPPPEGFYERHGFHSMEEHADHFALKELDLIPNGIYTISELLKTIESYASRNHCFPT